MGPQILTWLWLVWGLGVAAMVLSEVSRRRRAGRVLVDLGVPEDREQMGIAGRNLRLGFGSLMLVLGLIETFSPRFRIQGFVFVAWGSVSVAAVTIPRPFQIRQAGILGRKLFRWQDIQDYYLSPEGGLSLKLSGGWIGCVGNISTSHRQEVASLIASKVKVGATHAV